MGFFTRWLHSGTGSVICFNVPPSLQKSIADALVLLPQEAIACDPYAFHTSIADMVVKLYDDSVWRIRDEIRKIETSRYHLFVFSYPKKSYHNNRSPESEATADYPMLHETARHSIHSSETLDIAVECLLAMCEQHTLLSNRTLPKDKGREVSYTKIHQALQFRLQVLRSLRARSQANEARLRNEITLVR